MRTIVWIESIERPYWIVEIKNEKYPGWGVVIKDGRPAIYLDEGDAKFLWSHLAPQDQVRFRKIGIGPGKGRFFNVDWSRMMRVFKR